MIRILTYNIEFGKNLDEIYHWLNTQSLPLDIICLQEFPEKARANLNKKTLHEYENHSFSPGLMKGKEQLGQITICTNKFFKLLDYKSIDLGNDNLERLFKKNPTHRSALLTTFAYKKNIISIINVHLSVFSLNQERRKQILTTLTHTANIPLIILGDFNYSSLIGRDKFIQFMLTNNLTEAGEKIITNIYKGKIAQQLDYVFYKNLILQNIEVKNIKLSDHLPIYAVFTSHEK